MILRMIKSIVVSLVAICVSFSVFANSEQDFLKARTEYLCSWMELSSYHDKLGNLARDELGQRGWTIVPQINKTSNAEAKFNIATMTDEDNGQTTTLISVAGTSSLADIKSNIRLRTVPFHEPGSDDMKVHSGFNAYANTLLDSPYEKGTTVRSMLQHTAVSKQQPVIFTGHSLGGAVAVLLGARLIDDLGPNVQVVTFGAPAVGNQTFNAAYSDAMHLNRVVISGDPVKNILQDISGSYTQFGTETKWQADKSLNHFEHKMIVYTDAALRNYYDAKERYETELGHEIIEQTTSSLQPMTLFVVPPEFNLADDIAADQRYMKLASDDYLHNYWQGLVFSHQNTQSLTEVCGQAKKAGCQYILMRRFTGQKMKDTRHTFRMNLQEEIYDTQGRIISAQQYTTHTKDMTPIEATLYLTSQGQKKRIFVQ